MATTKVTPYVSYQKRQEWEKENHLKFQELDWDTDIKPILRECYELASNDINLEIPYSDVVLKNIQLITNKEPMSITYKQWKSFKVYHNTNLQKKTIQNNLHKLGI
jgi:hypothetical protein